MNLPQTISKGHNVSKLLIPLLCTRPTDFLDFYKPLIALIPTVCEWDTKGYGCFQSIDPLRNKCCLLPLQK